MKVKNTFGVFVLFATFSCFADSTCSLSSGPMSSQADTTLNIKQVKSVERTYFYTNPSDECITKTFVIKNDRLISFKKYDGFDYVLYIKKSGSTVKGWVKNEALSTVKYPGETINSSDYNVILDKVNISLGLSVTKFKNEVYAKMGKKIKLSMIGSDGNASIFGIDFPYNKDASVYVSDLNHLTRNNTEESVYQVSLYSDKYETSRGIKVGDDLRLVSQKYGENGIVDTREDGGKTLTFQYVDMSLTFVFNSSGKVGSIVYMLLPWSTVMSDLQCSKNTTLLNDVSKIIPCK